MSASQNVPSWVDPMLTHVLPGGKGWEVDRDAGHRLLAARISKWATSSFVDHACEADQACRLLFLREPTFRRIGAFTGSIEVHVASGSMEFKLHDFDGGGEFVLPIAHPVAFETLLVELTQPLELLPESELDGPSWGPALLRPVLPGGHRWEHDGAAGHPVLAARIHRLATEYLDLGKVWVEEPHVYERRSLPMADGFSLEMRRWQERRGGLWVGPDADGWQFSLRQLHAGLLVGFDPDRKPAPDEELPTVGLMLAKDEMRLPISDPFAFWRLVCELNRPRRFRW